MNVERFLIQVKQNLPEHDGVTTWVENSALNVGYGKSESFEINIPEAFVIMPQLRRPMNFINWLKKLIKLSKRLRSILI